MPSKHSSSLDTHGAYAPHRVAETEATIARAEARATSAAKQRRDAERLRFAGKVLRDIVDVMVTRQIRQDPLSSEELDALVAELAAGVPADVRRAIRNDVGEIGGGQSTELGRLVGEGVFGPARERARALSIDLANALEGKPWSPPAPEDPRELAAKIERA